MSKELRQASYPIYLTGEKRIGWLDSWAYKALKRLKSENCWDRIHGLEWIAGEGVLALLPFHLAGKG